MTTSYKKRLVQVAKGEELPNSASKTRSSASAVTHVSEKDALVALRKLHRLYLRACGGRFHAVPFRAYAVPGWTYDAATDTVLPILFKEP